MVSPNIYPIVKKLRFLGSVSLEYVAQYICSMENSQCILKVLRTIAGRGDTLVISQYFPSLFYNRALLLHIPLPIPLKSSNLCKTHGKCWSR